MIVALCTVVALLAVPTHEQGSQGDTLPSPCPNVFSYDSPESPEPGSWSGVVTLTTDILLHSLWLNIVLDRRAFNIQNWVGNSSTLDGMNFLIENDYLHIHPGNPFFVRFFIQYDPQNITPRLQGIRLNGLVICNADTSQRDTGPVFSNAPDSSFSRPGIKTNSDEEPVRTPASKPNSSVRPSPGIEINSDEKPVRTPASRPYYPVRPRPGIKTNSDEEPVRTPASKPTYPVRPRPVNKNSMGAIKPEQRNENRSTSSETIECGVVSGGNEGVTLSYSGMNYTKGDIPWLAAIYTLKDSVFKYICGGTLVSDRHVITAANCMLTRGVQVAIKEIVVSFGAHNFGDWSSDDTVMRSLVAVSFHEDFDPSSLRNNILIMSLKKRVEFNKYIRPVCLWSGDPDQSRIVGATGVVAGWGVRSVEDMNPHNDPHKVLAPIVSTSYCRASNPVFHRLTFNNTLCAGARNGVGPCIGDSGAGLCLLEGGKWRLRGIVSLSLVDEKTNSRCNLNDYIVYTDTAQYLTWIKHVLTVKYID